MNRLTPEQRLQIVQIYFERHGSIRETHQALREFYGAHNHPSERLIREHVDRFRNTFNPIDNMHLVRRPTVRSQEAIATVQRSVDNDPNVSIRRSQQVNLDHLLRRTLAE